MAGLKKSPTKTSIISLKQNNNEKKEPQFDIDDKILPMALFTNNDVTSLNVSIITSKIKFSSIDNIWIPVFVKNTGKEGIYRWFFFFFNFYIYFDLQ
jgi:hypothetical protein